MSQVTIYSDLNFGGSETRTELPSLQQLAMIVQHLTQLPAGETVTSEELATELGIDDLEFNEELKEKVLEHGSIIITTKKDKNHDAVNINQLLEELDKTRDGILLSEITDEGVLQDIEELRMGSRHLIAINNREKKTLTLYPRGKVYLTALSGRASIPHGGQTAAIEDSTDLLKEIRRGEAVCLTRKARTGTESAGLGGGGGGGGGGEVEITPDNEGRDGHRGGWFRVSTDTLTSNMMSKLPSSVSSFEGLHNPPTDYSLSFDSTHLPLTPHHHGPPLRSVSMYRHGVTNDVKAAWQNTLETLKTDPALIPLGLHFLTRNESSSSGSKRSGGGGGGGSSTLGEVAPRDLEELTYSLEEELIKNGMMKRPWANHISSTVEAPAPPPKGKRRATSKYVKREKNVLDTHNRHLQGGTLDRILNSSK